jgi:RNA 2',3'-cyclic 3'-phosphodiesterase
VTSSTGALRLFFALQPAPEQNTALVERIVPLVTRLDAQRVPAENLHTTLCFIGSVPADDLGRLRELAARQHGKAAKLRFDTLEYWRKPKVLCATAAENSGSTPAGELAANLASAALAEGFSPDVKPFRAHLTLARKVDAHCAMRCDWPQALTPALLVQCDRFVLMESRRGGSGSIYSVVDSWPLYA